MTDLTKAKNLFLLCLPLVLLSMKAGGDGSPEQVNIELKAPMRGLEEVGYHDVDLKGGFWGPRLQIHHEVTVGHALDRLDANGHVTNFDIGEAPPKPPS